MNLAPIVIFCFDRPYHLEKLLNSLKLNVELKDSIIYVFQDGFKDGRNFENWNKVSQIVNDSLNGFNYNFVIHKENLGCDSNIINGINHVFNKYEKLIILEDDLEVSPKFLSYMNFGLDYFEKEDNVGSINGFNLKSNVKSEYFFIKGANPWGWATWKRTWALLNLNVDELLSQIKDVNDFNYGKTIEILNNKPAWDVKWYASLYINNKLGLFPKVSYVYQNGFEGSGTHKHPQLITDSLFAVNELNNNVDQEYIKQLKLGEIKSNKYAHKHIFFKINGKPFTFKEKVISKYYLFKHFVKTKIFRLA